jgi:hypothetical protein
VLTLEKPQRWKYETNEFTGICEIARDDMTVKVVFEAVTDRFYDVLQMDRIIRLRLESPVSVERLADQLANDFPDVAVSVTGWAKSHGCITSGVVHRLF